VTNPAPSDLITYEQASDEFGVTVAQVRYLARKGAIKKYKRGQLRGVYVSRSELAAAIAIQPVPPSDSSTDDDE